MSPIYEYHCIDCGKYSDELHKIAETPNSITCHHCSGRARRALSAPNFVVPGGEVRVRGFSKDRSKKDD